MSYALTDAGEADMRAEMKVLEKLNEDIDELASEAIDCETVAPKVQRALHLAWFFTEEAMREAGRGSCGHVGFAERCCCCAHYREVGLRTQILRSRL